MPSKFSVRIYGVWRVYVAIETKCTVRKHISRAWITEVAEPYRTGHGWRVRLGHLALQCGICEKHPEIREGDEAFLNHLNMRWVPYRPGGDHDAPSQDDGAGLGLN